ncbi:MAG: toast rack family protein [Bacillota bacterium]
MSRGRIFWGLLLVFFGAVLLLSNFGLVDRYFWSNLLRFWPVLLIIWGLLTVMDRNSSASWPILFLIIVGLAVSFHFWGSYEVKHNAGATLHRGQTSLLIEPDIERASLDLNYGAGTLSIAGNSDRKLAFVYSDYESEPWIAQKTTGKHGEYSVKQKRDSFTNYLPGTGTRKWEFKLPANILWDLALDVGAAKATLDFREVDLKYLDLNMGAGDVTIWIGDRRLETELKVDAGASNIKIIVPDNIGLKVKMDGGLNSSNLDSIGLVKDGSYYVTENSTSSSKLFLNFSGGVNKFELLRWPAGEVI